MTDLEYLRAALSEARAAEAADEVPVGAIAVFQGEIVGRGQNRTLRDLDPTAHAEVIALRQAARRLGNFRLTGCELFVTLEPCAICAGAMIQARIARLVYAAPDPKAGAVTSVLHVLNHPRLNHRIEVAGGELAEECGELLREFFRRRREPGFFTEVRAQERTREENAGKGR